MLTQIKACENLFYTATGTAFADIMIDGHRETWPIRSKRFRAWLRRRYYESTEEAASARASRRSSAERISAAGVFDLNQI